MVRATSLYAAAASLLFTACLAQQPAAIYDGGLGNGTNGTVKLNIGNGGAGQSGLVKGPLTLSWTFTYQHH
jgi:hypothetical protein